MSIQAAAAFEAEFGRKPGASIQDDNWLAGYDKARTDNSGALKLMEQEINAWRGGQLQFIGHKNDARDLRKEIARLQAELVAVHEQCSAFKKVKAIMKGGA